MLSGTYDKNMPMSREKCWYCDELRACENDHAPIPQRHGGSITVPACLRCHTLKDRASFEEWPIKVAREIAWDALVEVHALFVALLDEWDENDLVCRGDEHEWLERVARYRPVGRLFVARMTAWALDVRAGRVLLQPGDIESLRDKLPLPAALSD